MSGLEPTVPVVAPVSSDFWKLMYDVTRQWSAVLAYNFIYLLEVLMLVLLYIAGAFFLARWAPDVLKQWVIEGPIIVILARSFHGGGPQTPPPSTPQTK